MEFDMYNCEKCGEPTIIIYDQWFDKEYGIKIYCAKCDESIYIRDGQKLI